MWLQYTKHVDRRDAVIHQGRPVSKDEAEDSCRTVENLISRMKQAMEQQV